MTSIRTGYPPASQKPPKARADRRRRVRVSDMGAGLGADGGIMPRGAVARKSGIPPAAVRDPRRGPTPRLRPARRPSGSAPCSRAFPCTTSPSTGSTPRALGGGGAWAAGAGDRGARGAVAAVRPAGGLDEAGPPAFPGLRAAVRAEAAGPGRAGGGGRSRAAGLRARTYRSRIVVRQGDPAQDLSDLRGRVVAVNSEDSQSGAGALRTAVGGLSPGGAFLPPLWPRGHMRARSGPSPRGRADVAAIDAVTWEMARRYIPRRAPFRSCCPRPKRRACLSSRGRAARRRPSFPRCGRRWRPSGPEAREALMLRDVVPRREEDFDGIAAADAAARSLEPS
jgi:hypothetical protein